MKKLAFLLFLMLILSGCGGGGRGDDEITIILRGLVTQGTAGPTQGNPVTSGEVTIQELNRTDEIEVANPGVYSISNVPAEERSYTVQYSDPNAQFISVTCGITIHDTTSIEITSNPQACSIGTPNSLGELVLNITADVV
jgi:hypothetical protein